MQLAQISLSQEPQNKTKQLPNLYFWREFFTPNFQEYLYKQKILDFFRNIRNKGEKFRAWSVPGQTRS